MNQLDCFAEEYTKISTPRQEVLFKKGSIGKKRPGAQTQPVATRADNDDTLNGNAASPGSPTSSPTGDADSFQYSGQCNLTL